MGMSTMTGLYNKKKKRKQAWVLQQERCDLPMDLRQFVGNVLNRCLTKGKSLELGIANLCNSDIETRSHLFFRFHYSCGCFNLCQLKTHQKILLLLAWQQQPSMDRNKSPKSPNLSICSLGKLMSPSGTEQPVH